MTRIETSRTPIIGGICDALPCIYVDRNKGGGSDNSGASTSASATPAALSTTDKLTARITAKHECPSAPLRPVVAFVEVRPPPPPPPIFTLRRSGRGGALEPSGII